MTKRCMMAVVVLPLAAMAASKERILYFEEFDRYAVINGRTRLSPWTNGGGGQSAMPGLEVETHAEPPALAVIENYSTFIG